MAAKFRITGIEQTIRRLQTFDKKFQSKTLRNAGAEGSKIILKEMKSETPTRKRDYGVGGATRKSLGRKVSVKKGRLWFGAGPRTKWKREVNHGVKFFRSRATGRIHKIKLREQRSADESQGRETQQPSRKMHLVEKKHGVLKKTHAKTKKRTQDKVIEVLRQAMREA